MPQGFPQFNPIFTSGGVSKSWSGLQYKTGTGWPQYHIVEHMPQVYRRLEHLVERYRTLYHL
jgi:hypothetical protein